MSGGPGALPVLLGVTQISMALILFLPVAMLVGLASGRALAGLSAAAWLMLMGMAAPAVWVLALGIRCFAGLTPATARALRWTQAIAIAGAVLLGLGGVLALQAAARSAARGGGLLGGFGLVPLAMGVVLGGLALLSLWLVRTVMRPPSARAAR